MELCNARILVTGAGGFIGQNLVALMRERGWNPVALIRSDYDLTEQSEIRRMLSEHRPEVVFHLAARVGGIGANKTYPGDFCYQNLAMSTMMLHESWKNGVKKYVTFASGCSYPAKAPSPIKETELFNGYPQMENAPYSLAKAMNAVQADAYRRQHGFDAIVLVPGNVYGPGDNFDLNNSHVVPALIRKFVEAKTCNKPEVPAWGTGKPSRDFVYVADVCEAVLLAAEKYSGSDIINISSGRSVTIKELTETVAELTGYPGRVAWDTSKPDGQMLKGFDVSRLKEILNYECPTALRTGLKKTIDWYLAKAA